MFTDALLRSTSLRTHDNATDPDLNVGTTTPCATGLPYGTRLFHADCNSTREKRPDGAEAFAIA